MEQGEPCECIDDSTDERMSFSRVVLEFIGNTKSNRSPEVDVRTFYITLAALVLGSWNPPSNAQPQSARTFDAYMVDVEGGEATLFVSPSGESLLVDTGWPGFEGRDADRIAVVAKQAGIKQIDYLVATHFHTDHIGGTAPLAARLPIRHFIDHGTTVDEGERARPLFQGYAEVRRRGVHKEAVPGDAIPVAGLDVRVIAAGGSVLEKPLPGAGAANALCAGFKPQGPEITSRAADAEDRSSVSVFITYGRFRTVIMGDLTWNKEFDLMCPNNKLGSVDVYFVSHHGSDTSGSEALVHALRPRAAIMNNGPRKGGATVTFQILSVSPGLADLWQNHYSVVAGPQHNRPEAFIANLEEGSPPAGAPGQAPVHMGPAHWIKLAASADGSFSITNSRTGMTKRYDASK
jgi:beta-lactamase superfamily II metal-dependent hydrolase